MNRRRFLGISLTSGASLIAGCGGNGSNSDGQSGGNSDGRPNFESASLTAPSEVPFGTEFSLTIEANNSGGEGEFTATVVSTSESLSFEQDIQATVPSGESIEIETDPISPPGVGEYEFKLTDEKEYEIVTEGSEVQSETVVDGLSGEIDRATVTVVSQAMSPGEAVDIEDGLMLSVGGVEFEKTIYTGSRDDEYPQGVIRAEDGDVFAMYDVTLENTGENSKIWDPGLVHLPNGEFYDLGNVPLYDYEENLGVNTSVSSGQTISGYFIVTYDSENIESGLPVEIQTDSETDTPEYSWTFDSVQAGPFPRFEVTDLDVPETASVGEEIDFTVTVSNTGEANGTVRTLLQTTRVAVVGWGGIRDPISTPAVAEEIEAGESRALTVSYSCPVDGEFGFRLYPFEDSTWKTTFEE